MEIKVDASALKELRFYLLKKASQRKGAARTALNDLGFMLRNFIADKAIPWYFVNRNKWVNKSMHVTRATNTKLQVTVGARMLWGKEKEGKSGRDKRKPFVGLGDQERGGETWGKSVPTRFSRGGSFGKKVRPGRTFKGMVGSKEVRIIRQKHGTYAGEIRKHIAKHGRKEPFRIDSTSGGMKAGVYLPFGKLRRIGRDKRKTVGVKMVKDETQKTVKIKPVPFMRNSIKIQWTNQTIRAAFFKRMHQYLSEYKVFKGKGRV